MFSPIIYFLLGSLFTYFAYMSITDTIWNVTTILLLLLASLEFFLGFRFLKYQLKQNDNNEK